MMPLNGKISPVRGLKHSLGPSTSSCSWGHVSYRSAVVQLYKLCLALAPLLCRGREAKCSALAGMADPCSHVAYTLARAAQRGSSRRRSPENRRSGHGPGGRYLQIGSRGTGVGPVDLNYYSFFHFLFVAGLQ